MVSTELAAEKNDALSPVARAGSVDSGGIQSVSRALNILEAIAAKGGECALTELARTTSLNISTCHHLLSTLAARGYVTQAKKGRGYALGARILHLSHARQQMGLPHRAEPYADRVAQATGESVLLAVMQGDQVVTLIKRESPHAMRAELGSIGRQNAPHATAVGKSILAWLPENEMRRIAEAGGMARFTPSTITEMEALLEELRIVRRGGVAIDREEFQPGVIALGAAIRDPAGGVIGAISVSAPLMRVTKNHLAMMRKEVVSAARDLSTELQA
jgi:IclR family transcriptional regulator, acetate operon repressor